MNHSSHNYVKQLMVFFQSLVELSKYKAEEPEFRVLEFPTGDNPHVQIQLVGRSVVLKMLPEEIMRDGLLLRFGRADIAMITHLGTKNELKILNKKERTKLFRIIRQIFSKNKLSFIIEKEDGIVEEHNVGDLYNNEEIVEGLGGKDGVRVGYAMAEEHYGKVFELKKIKAV